MLITVTDRGGELDQRRRLGVERRLRFALSRFDSRITRTDFILGDDESPAGEGQTVRLLIKLRGSENVVVSDRDQNLDVCIARLAERAARAVRRAIDRSKAYEPVWQPSGSYRNAH